MIAFVESNRYCDRSWLGDELSIYLLNFKRCRDAHALFKYIFIHLNAYGQL
jgi:hypothetical protein